MLPRLLISLLCLQRILCQMNLSPFVELLKPESMSRFVDIASELSSLAATSVAQNERDVKATVEDPREVSLGANARPSQVLGQVMSNMASQSRDMFLGALAPLDKNSKIEQKEKVEKPDSGPTKRELKIKSLVPSRPQGGFTKDVFSLTQPTEPPPLTTEAPRRAAAAKILTVGNTAQTAAVAEPAPAEVPSVQTNPFLELASSFLRGASGGSQDAGGSGTSSGRDELPNIGIKDILPGAKNNFGIPKGQGCLPFLSEFMQAAYGNCQQVADEGAWDAWGNELKSAILTGQIDLLRASQETCRRGAERQQCAALRQAISTCDILASLRIGGQLQRAMKRCEDVSGLVDQNPMVVLSQINGLIGGEVAQGFFNKFLGAGSQG